MKSKLIENTELYRRVFGKVLSLINVIKDRESQNVHTWPITFEVYVYPNH